MKLKNNGSTRIVLLTKRFALKFPRIDSWMCFVQGMLSNLTEGKLKDYGNQHLCPIKYSNRFGLLVVMVRAQEVTDERKFRAELSQLLDDESEGTDPSKLGADFFEYDGGVKNFGYIDSSRGLTSWTFTKIYTSRQTLALFIF